MTSNERLKQEIVHQHPSNNSKLHVSQRNVGSLQKNLRKKTVIHVTVRPKETRTFSQVQPLRTGTQDEGISERPELSPSENITSYSNNKTQQVRVLSGIMIDGSCQDDHHREKKTKYNTDRCSMKHAISILCIGLILAGMIAAIVTLVVVFTSQKKSTSSIKDVVLHWNPVGITVAGVTNQSGNTMDKLSEPRAFTLDYNNTLYVADYWNHRIQRYYRNEVVGTTVAGLANGTYVRTLSGLFLPHGIQVDDESNLYISDSGNTRVVFWPKYALNGTILIANICIPSILSRDTATGNLYAPDYCYHRIWSYTHLNKTGRVLVGNGNGTSNNQLLYPTAVHFDTFSQSMIITNFAANNIVRWKLGDGSWTLLAGNANGSAGGTSTELANPSGATVDPMGNLYVADRYNGRIQLFMAGSSVGITVAGIFRKRGMNATLLQAPWSVGFDSQLNLYVADADNHRIQKFLRY